MDVPATPRTHDRWAALRAPAVVAVAAAVGALAVHLRDPNVAGSWGPAGIGLCPFSAITGLWCPGCGGLRAIHALTKLDVVAALSSNVLVVALVVVVAGAWTRWVWRRWHDHPAARMLVLSPRAGNVVLVTLAIFAVLRNLPFGAFLAP